MCRIVLILRMITRSVKKQNREKLLHCILATVNVSDYYTFCVNPATKRFTNTATLNLVTYDLTAIQERSRQRMEMSEIEKIVNLNSHVQVV